MKAFLEKALSVQVNRPLFCCSFYEQKKECPNCGKWFYKGENHQCSNQK